MASPVSSASPWHALRCFPIKRQQRRARGESPALIIQIMSTIPKKMTHARERDTLSAHVPRFSFPPNLLVSISFLLPRSAPIYSYLHLSTPIYTKNRTLCWNSRHRLRRMPSQREAKRGFSPWTETIWRVKVRPSETKRGERKSWSKHAPSASRFFQI